MSGQDKDLDLIPLHDPSLLLQTQAQVRKHIKANRGVKQVMSIRDLHRIGILINSKMWFSPEEIKESKVTGNNKGVYVLFFGIEVIYVGKSSNVLHRINSHSYTKEFSKVEIHILEHSFDISYLEAVLINRYRPTLNKQWVDDRSVFKIYNLEELISNPTTMLNPHSHPKDFDLHQKN